MRKRGVLVALVLLAVGAGLWWMSGSRRSQDSFPGAPVPASTDGGELAALLTEPALPEPEVVVAPRTPRGERTVVEPDTKRVAAAAAREEESPSAEATLIVRVIRSDTGVAIPHERLVLQPQDPDYGEANQGWSTAEIATYVEGSGGSLGDAPRADEDGRCTFHFPAGVGTRAFALRAFNAEDADVLVEPLAAGETREVTLVMPVFQVWIRVESAPDRASIAGANVRVQEDDQEVSTGIDGLAEMWCSEWRNERLVIDAEGYATAYALLQRGHEQPQEALVVGLNRSACLAGRVVDEADKPILGARVSVVADGWDLSPNKINPWEATGSITLFGDRTWSEQSDASGVFTLCGLTPSIPLQVTVSKGSRLRLNVTDPMQLDPGENREVVYRLCAGAIVMGVVRDEAGKPVPRCKLWLKAENESFAESHSPIERLLRSKSDGTFALKDVPPGEWFLGPTLDSGYLPRPTAIHVPEGAASVDVVVETQAALFIAGRVLGPAGEPVPDAFIHIHSEEASGQSGPDGSFRVGPVRAGQLTLGVTCFHTGMFLPEPVDAEAGQENIEVRLALGGSLSGHLVDAATEQPTKGTVTLSPGGEMTLFAQADPTGRFAFQGLPPGTYVMTGRSPTGSVGFLERVEVVGPGPGDQDIVLRLAPGGQLTLRFPSDKEYRQYRVRSGASVLLWDGVGSEEVVTAHLPVGTVTVDLLAPSEELLLSKEATVRAGETVLVDLSKEP